MKLVVLVLNKVEILEPLLEKMTEHGIKGATILDSTGMARVIGDFDGTPLWSLKKILNPERKHNKTILTVCDDEKVREVVDLMKTAVGDINEPDSGIVFALPIDFVEGLHN